MRPIQAEVMQSGPYPTMKKQDRKQLPRLGSEAEDNQTPPKGPIKSCFVHSQRAKGLLTCGNTCPRWDSTGFQALKSVGTPENMPSTAQSGPVRLSPTAGVCTLCTSRFRPSNSPADCSSGIPSHQPATPSTGPTVESDVSRSGRRCAANRCRRRPLPPPGRSPRQCSSRADNR